MILPASGSEYLAPLLSNTSEYPRALPRISRMNSSVMSATPQGSQRSLQRQYMTGPPARSMLRAEMSSGRPQPRQHPEACARPFGVFYTDMRGRNETTDETTQPYGAMTGLMYRLVRGGGG